MNAFGGIYRVKIWTDFMEMKSMKCHIATIVIDQGAKYIMKNNMAAAEAAVVAEENKSE